MRRKIILDCDTGRDDAIAIALACASPDEIDLLGVTTVAGNIPLALTERNSRLVLQLCGRRDVPVFAGADRPLMRALVTAEAAHGASGLDGVAIFDPEVVLQKEHAVDFILRTLAASAPGSITLVVTGPMTNIALAAMQSPEILARAAEIVVMGGSSKAGGNATPAAEFNILVDAEAAARVLTAGVPVTMFGLDVTYQVLARETHAARLAAGPSHAAQALAPILRPLPHWNTEKLGPGVVPMHDPCTILWLIRPDLFEMKHLNLEVETASPLSYGQTVVDPWGYSGRKPNVLWALAADGAAAMDLVVERLLSLG